MRINSVKTFELKITQIIMGLSSRHNLFYEDILEDYNDLKRSTQGVCFQIASKEFQFQKPELKELDSEPD